MDFVKKMLIVYPEDLILEQGSVGLFVLLFDLHGVLFWLLALSAVISVCITLSLLLGRNEWC